jgi:hypothetical protein
LAGPVQAAGMSEEVERPGGRAALVRALEVRRHGAHGAVVGVAAAVALALVFVVLPGGTTRAAPLYLALGFVVFVSVTLLTVTIQVGRRAMALSVEPAALVRRAARVGTLGGGLWLVAGLAVLGGEVARPLLGVALPWAPLLALFGLWAVHTYVKRQTIDRRVLAAVAATGVLGSLLVSVAATTARPALLGDWGAGGLAATPPVGTFLAGLALLGASLLVEGAALGLAGDRLAGGLLVAAALGLAAVVAGASTGATAVGLVSVTLGVAWLAVGRRLRTTDGALGAEDRDRAVDPT